MSNVMKWFKDCDEAKKLSFFFFSFFFNPAEYAVKEGVLYNKAQTETTETPPYSPPAN